LRGTRGPHNATQRNIDMVAHTNRIRRVPNRQTNHQRNITPIDKPARLDTHQLLKGPG
jgi:hypothetical protein